MISDRQVKVSLGCLVAYGLWVVTVALLAIDSLTTDLALTSWGLACSAAAATATIRQYFVRQNRLIRKVFELARDDRRGRHGSIVEPIRHREPTL